MEYLSDLLLTAAALGAAAYCFVLSRRLRALTSLDAGLGSAIAVLSGQVDDLSRSLRAAQEVAGRTGSRLDAQTARAEAVVRKLELLMASMHDLPEEQAPPAPASSAQAAVARPVWPPADGGARSARATAAHVQTTEPAMNEGREDPVTRPRVFRRRQAMGPL